MAYGNEQNIERLKEQGERISYDLLGFRHGQQDNDCSHSVPEKYRQDSDIWSLGIMVYEILTGKKPYSEHSTLINKMNAIVEG